MLSKIHSWPKTSEPTASIQFFQIVAWILVSLRWFAQYIETYINVAVFTESFSIFLLYSSKPSTIVSWLHMKSNRVFTSHLRSSYDDKMSESLQTEELWVNSEIENRASKYIHGKIIQMLCRSQSLCYFPKCVICSMLSMPWHHELFPHLSIILPVVRTLNLSHSGIQSYEEGHSTRAHF